MKQHITLKQMINKLTDNKFLIGNNGYYFVNGFHVDKDYYDKELIKDKLDEIINKLEQL